MSIRQMAEVWRYELTHPQLVVMLALADHADDDGENIYPSVDYTAWKVGYSRRSVQNILGELRQIGILRIVAPARDRRPNEYEIDWSKATPKEPFVRKWVQQAAPLEKAGGVQQAAPQGCNPGATGVQQAAPKSSLTITSTVINPPTPLEPTAPPANSADATRSESKPEKLKNQKPPKKEKPVNPHGRFDPLAVELPSCVPAETWALWVRYRIERKKALTPTSVQQQLAFLSRHPGRAAEIIEASIRNGWQGLFAQENLSNHNPPPTDWRAAHNAFIRSTKGALSEETYRRLLEINGITDDDITEVEDAVLNGVRDEPDTTQTEPLEAAAVPLEHLWGAALPRSS